MGRTEALKYVMQRMLYTFKTTITAAHAMKLFTAKKESKRSWPEHYLYLVVVSDAEQQVLDNIVRYAASELSTILMAKYQTHRIDYLVHAEELAHFAQAIEMEALSGRSFGKEVVAHVDESVSRKETDTFHGCGKVGHLKKNCRSKKNDDKKRVRGPKDGGSITLAVGEGRGRNGSRATGKSLAMAIGDDSNDEYDD